MFDTHCHLDDEAFEQDLDVVIARAHAAGVERMLAPGTTIASSRRCIEIASANPSVFAAVAIHPNSILDDLSHLPDLAAEFDRIFEELATQPKVVAIGETGLDEYWDFVPIEVQKEYLCRHLHVARRANLPIILHCREAEQALLDTLREDFDRNSVVPGVIHSFSGDSAFLAACLELGFFISFSGSATYTNRKFRKIQECAALTPSDRILSETDSPYLTPTPFRGKVSRNAPEYMTHTLEALASLRGESVESLQQTTSENALRLFGRGL
ncbi:MAG: TatD family hydrolase [Planctomycetia bacterium]|nr:TatD family hydrolase [Planctomycetia bacterium]